MAEIKNTQLIRDALGSPVPQYWDETSQTYIVLTVDGSIADVDFKKTKLLRDKLGSPIPQVWDVETAKFVPGKPSTGDGVSQSDLDELSKQLAEKLNKGGVAVTDINKSLGKLDQTYMTDTFLQQMAGTTPINAVVANKGVTNEKLADSAVDFSKTNFLSRGKNLFDKSDVSVGYYVYSLNGVLVSEPYYNASGWVAVKQNTQYSRVYGSRHISFYDANKVFISGLAKSGASFTTPVNCFYIRVSVTHAELSSERIEEGSVLVGDFEEFAYNIEKVGIKEKNMRFPIIKVINSKNFFDASTAIDGFYVSSSNGIAYESSPYCISDFIPVKPSSVISIKHMNQIAFYNRGKIFVSGLQGFSPITVPANVYFMRITTFITNKYSQQIEEGAFKTEYENSGEHIQSKNIPLSYSNQVKSDIKTDIKNRNPKTVGESLKNPFIKTQIRLLGDSITDGLGGTGYSSTGPTITATFKQNVLTSTNWANMLYNFVKAKFNKEFLVSFADPRIKYDAGAIVYESNAVTSITGSTAKIANTHVARIANFEFYGDHISLFYTSNLNNGIFDVYIDGVKTSVDTYGASLSYKQERVISGLSQGIHAVEIWTTNTKNESSSNNELIFEGFKIPKTATVINNGMSGITSAALPNDLITADDDFVFYQIGTNDRGTFSSPTTTKNNVNNFISLASKRSKALIVLMTANAVSVAQDTQPSKNFRMDDVELAISDVASRRGLPYINNYDAFIRYAENTGVTIDSLLADGLHPNDLGYKVMYDNISREIGIPVLRNGMSL